RLNLDDIVSGENKLSQINEGYQMIRNTKVNRVVITDFSYSSCRATGPGPFANVLTNIHAPASASPAIAQIRTANEEIKVTADLNSGSLSIPAADSSRHRAKNFARPTGGE